MLTSFWTKEADAGIEHKDNLFNEWSWQTGYLPVEESN